MGEATALEVVHQMAEAMAYAFDRCGMVHRDLKPAKLRADRPGDKGVRIVNFGVSTFLERNELEDFGSVRQRLVDEDRPDLLMGTPAYMAPEQAEGAAPTPSMDVFAIGATLVHLLTGHPHSLPALLVRLHQGDIPGLPEDLSVTPSTRHLVSHCLARNPVDRFRTWKHLIHAIEGSRYRAGLHR
jgi:serine/threonine protein kinase